MDYDDTFDWTAPWMYPAESVSIEANIAKWGNFTAEYVGRHAVKFTGGPFDGVILRWDRDTRTVQLTFPEGPIDLEGVSFKSSGNGAITVNAPGLVDPKARKAV